jgi:hypothetical protein
LPAAVRYENLLTRSFAIVRRKPWLWLLALLAGQTGSGGGAGGGGGSSFQFPYNSSSPGTEAVDYSWVPHWLADRAFLFVELAVAILVLSLAWFLVSCIASPALVGAVARIDAGEPITFGGAWRIGAAAFRRVLLFKLLVVLLLLLPALLLALPPLLGSPAGNRGVLVGLVLDVPLVFAYFYWAIFIGWLSELALRACVLEERGPRASFAAAWALLKRRFHRIALTTLVFIGVGFGIGILTSVVFAFVQAPFTAAVYNEVGQGRWSDLPGTLALFLAILVPVSLAVSSAVGAYFATAWTVAYRRFDFDDGVPEPPALAA